MKDPAEALFFPPIQLNFPPQLHPDLPLSVHLDPVFLSHLSAMHNSPYDPLPPEDYSPSRRLTPLQIQMIEEALCSLGEYGEVRLVVDKNRLRFLITQKSFDALKWQPGSIVKDFPK